MREGEDNTQTGEEPSSSTAIPGTAGERRTREAPMEEHLTSEDWAIMSAVERCTVWRALKSFNLRQREKLLAAVCMVLQETVEGNANRSTVNVPEYFRDWGRRWGQDDERAQLVMQNQWDNLLRHIVGITVAMEVWEPSTASSSGEEANATDKNSEVEGQEGEPSRQAQGGGAQFSPTDENAGRLDDGETHERQDGPTQCSGDKNAPLDKNGEVERVLREFHRGNSPSRGTCVLSIVFPHYLHLISQYFVCSLYIVTTP